MGTFAQKDTLFSEYFYNNNIKWPIYNDNSGKSSVENGYYNWKHKSDGLNSLWISTAISVRTDFIIEIKFKVEKDNEYGIIWGGKDVNNANYFTISSGKFRIFKNQRSELTTFTDYTASSAILPDSNVLKIQKKADNLLYFINNQKVSEQPFDRVMGLNTGFSVWGKTNVSVDYLFILQDKQNINLAPNLKYDSSPENLGENINTGFNESYPIISPDDSILYFIRRKNFKNIGGREDLSDIYISRKTSEGWSLSENIGKPLNNTSPNAVCSVTPDGNTLLVINKYDYFGNSAGSGTSISHRTNSGWSVPAMLNIKKDYNLNDYKESCLSNDGKTLLLTIERNDSWGEKDVYVCFLNDDNSWTEPMNLGNVVNTECSETSPFLASDGITLYYSTSGLPTYGSNDIFITKRLDDTWKNWSEPQNIGQPINSTGWDAYYSLAASGEYAYFVSNQNSKGGEDIFRIKLPQQIKPNPVVLVSGNVYNAKTKEPISASLLYETLPEGVNVGNALSSPENGSYKIVLPYGKNYSFRATANQFISVSENLNLDSVAEYKEIKRDLYLVPIEVGQTIRLNNIFFDFGKATLRSESFPELERVVKVMQENPTLEIEMSGHTDNVGSEADNLSLSSNRAKSVMEYIVSKGIDSKRIASKGYGETKPVATNDTDEGRQLNRRVEFTILKK